MSLKRLFEAVKVVESNNNPYALRFEPKFANKIKTNDKAFKRASRYLYTITDETIRTYLSFSVGRCQFMVYNFYFYDLLHSRLIVEKLIPVRIPFIVDEVIEYDLFVDFLIAKNKKLAYELEKSLDDDKLKEFSRLWNGSIDYFERLKLAL